MINRKFHPFLTKPKTFLDIFRIFKDMKVEPIEKCSFRTPEHGFVSFFILNFKEIIYIPDLIIKVLTLNTQYILEHIINYLFLFWLTISLYILITIFLYITRVTKTSIITKTAEFAQQKICAFLHINQYVFLFLCYLFIWYFNNILDKLNNIFISYPFLHNEGKYLDETIIIYRYFPLIWHFYGVPKLILNYWEKNRLSVLEYYKIVYSPLI
uniref:Ycf89 n=1 Tax=Nitzschia sp. IriIs04 TaxID=1444690 RepID=A0A0S3QPM2_9STRA|nr:Ycf89 [Nitzschia sp. IriIs04]YP_009193354.1 Ycf89 [Nitzschia sp. IriIs04]BAT70251.1 Ycf89 [Nitzschia sp. IriIs04]BAT70279.1 Ycf89 [Nitzschia sp. IriIs04]